MTQLPILLVDDEEGIRTVLSITLMDSGYPVDTAPDVESALTLFRAKLHPIVITDIKMPGQSGIDLLREVKVIAPKTEVIMITGHGDMELAVQSLKNDAFDFITKPINNDVLSFALQRAEERILMRRELDAHTRNLEELVEKKSVELVKIERRVATSQIFDGLTSNLDAFTANLDNISMFNQMPLFVSIHNRDMKVVSVNEHYKDRLGDLTGKASCSMFDGLLDAAKDCPVAKTLKGGAVARVSHVVLCKNGNRHPVLVKIGRASCRERVCRDVEIPVCAGALHNKSKTSSQR